MNMLRTASALVGTVAAVVIGGAAFAAGADDPAPGASADGGGAVEMLPNGDVVPPADDNPSPDDSATATPSPAASTSAPAANSPRSIGVDRATAIAIRAAGGGYVRSIERETEHGRAVFDVEVIAKGVEHDIDVDRATGEVTRHLSGDDDSGHGSDDSGTGGRGSDNNGTGGRGSADNGSGGHGSDD